MRALTAYHPARLPDRHVVDLFRLPARGGTLWRETINSALPSVLVLSHPPSASLSLVCVRSLSLVSSLDFRQAVMNVCRNDATIQVGSACRDLDL